MANLHTGEQAQNKKSIRGTSFDIDFPELPSLAQNPFEVELIQSRGAHDVLKLRFRQTSREHTETAVTGMPVRFRWTQNSTSNTWVGYVSYVSYTTRSNLDGVMEVVCVGASFPLKKRVTKVFTDCTITEVVSKLAAEVGLEFIGDASSRKFPQLSVAGQSYWSWIQEQANRLGYVAFVKGVTLYFQKLDTVINSLTDSAPVFSLENSQDGLSGQALYDRTLATFKVLRGDYVEAMDTVRTSMSTGGVNPTTGQLVGGHASPATSGTPTRSTVSDVLFNVQRTDQVTFSTTDSNELANNLSQLARFTIPAKIAGIGDYRCYPNALVKVVATGTLTDGYWLIKDVTHNFNMYGGYTVDMTVLSDGTNEPTLKAFDAINTEGRNVINIAEKLNGVSSTTSSRPESSPVLSTPSIPILVQDLSFSSLGSVWKA